MTYMKAYKFHSFNKLRDLDSLINGTLYFSTLQDFNDPFEGQLKIVRPDLTKEEEEKETFLWLAKSINRNTGKDLVSAYIEAKEKIGNSKNTLDNKLTILESEISKLSLNEFNRHGYLCLSGDKKESTGQQLTHILMWSHYANGLRGFCIEFNFELLLDSLITYNKQNFLSSEIEYLSEFPKVKLLDLDPKKESKLIKAILTKSSYWSYENEVRIVTEKPGLYNYSHDAISCIYIGEKMEQNNKNNLISKISEYLPSVDYKFMRLNPDNYSLYATET